MTSQPPPHAGHEDVTEALIADLRARQAKGIATYGTSLQSWNGRDPTQDALEEALDLSQYLKQWQMERRDLLAEVAQLRAQLANTEDSRRELCDLAEATQERAASAEARASAAEQRIRFIEHALGSEMRDGDAVEAVRRMRDEAASLAAVVTRLTAEKAGLLAQMARIGRA